ncbi:MAG: HD-GYP domain-containing protein [Spirochaetaceae bacterium]
MAHYEDVIMCDVWSLQEGMTVAAPVEVEGNVLVQKGNSLSDKRIKALRQRVLQGKDITVFIFIDNKEKLIRGLVKSLMGYLDRDVYYPIAEGGMLEKRVEKVMIRIFQRTGSLFDYYNDYVSDANRKKAFSEEALFEPFEIVMHNVGTAVLAIAAEIAATKIFDEEALVELGTAAILHDAALEYVERSDRGLLKIHPHEAAENFKALGEKIYYGIRHHHEVDDGSGYPEKLKGEEISDIAKSIRTFCAFDTLNHKFYKDVRPEFDLRDPKIRGISLFYSLLEISHLYSIGKYSHSSVEKLLKLYNLQELSANPLLLEDLRKIPRLCPGGYSTAVVDFTPGKRPTVVRCLDAFIECNAAQKMGYNMKDPRSNHGIYRGKESYRCVPLTKFLNDVYDSK